MKLLPGRGVMGIDCAVSGASDPTPMPPERVRAALAGTGIVVKARCGGTPEEIERTIAALAGPDLRLMLDIRRVDDNDDAYARAAEANYKLARGLLERAYSG